jgi:hypothetical protein
LRLAKREGEKPSLWKRIKDIAFTDVNVVISGLDEGSLEKIEETLLAADFGVPATMRLVDLVESMSRGGKIRTEQQFQDVVRKEIVSILSAGNAETALRIAAEAPSVYLMVGVNGVGKTTTIGILAQPDWRNPEALRALGRPRLFAAISAGAMDSMVNHYIYTRWFYHLLPAKILKHQILRNN